MFMTELQTLRMPEGNGLLITALLGSGVPHFFCGETDRFGGVYILIRAVDS